MVLPLREVGARIEEIQFGLALYGKGMFAGVSPTACWHNHLRETKSGGRSSEVVDLTIDLVPFGHPTILGECEPEVLGRIPSSLELHQAVSGDRSGFNGEQVTVMSAAMAMAFIRSFEGGDHPPIRSFLPEVGLPLLVGPGAPHRGPINDEQSHRFQLPGLRKALVGDARSRRLILTASIFAAPPR